MRNMLPMRRSVSSRTHPTSPRRPKGARRSSLRLAHLWSFGKAAAQDPPSMSGMRNSLAAAQLNGFPPAEIYQDALTLRPDWKNRLPSLSALMSEESLPAESPAPEAP